MRVPHKTTFDTSWKMVKCHEVPRLPRKTTLQPVLKPRKGFAASPIDTAMAPQRPGVLTFHTSQLQNPCVPTSFPTNRPQNQRFVRAFRRFSAHVTICHACHGICTLSPLAAALTMPFAENAQHDMSKVLRLPRKMTLEVSKVLRLPRKMQRIFWKRSKTIVPTTQNHFWHVLKNMLECHELPRLPREMKLCDAGKLQKGPFLKNLP